MTQNIPAVVSQPYYVTSWAFMGLTHTDLSGLCHTQTLNCLYSWVGSPGPTGVRSLGAKLPPPLTPHLISHQIFDLSIVGLTGNQCDSVDSGGAETRPLFHHPGVSQNRE